MSTAVEVIKLALNRVGAHSFVQPADPSIIEASLTYLRSALETLRKNEIILEETVSEVTTTVAVPDALADELNEPTAATIHLIDYLATDLAPLCRVPMTNGLILQKRRAYMEMARVYRCATIDNKVPSSHLPIGQGSGRGPKRKTFMGGSALADDTSTAA